MAKSTWKPISKIKATPTAIGAILGGVTGLIVAGKQDGPIGAVIGVAAGALAGNFLIVKKGRR